MAKKRKRKPGGGRPSSSSRSAGAGRAGAGREGAGRAGTGQMGTGQMGTGSSATRGDTAKARPARTSGRPAVRPGTTSPRGRVAPQATDRPARSEAIRRQAERDRAEQRRRRYRGLIVAGGLVLALILLLVLEVYVHRLNGAERRLLAEAPAAAAAAGCSPVQTIPPYPGGLDRVHIGSPQARLMPPLSTYPSDPPASGPHNPVPLDAGVYSNPPHLDMAIHSLEHAAVIVWYNPTTASSAELDRIQAFFRTGNEKNHMIVAPYDYPDQGAGGELPSGRQMALVAWHRIQYCDRPSLAVAYAFVHRYRFNLYQRGAYQGVAPEKFTPI